MAGNPTRHVILALSLAALVYIIADRSWAGNIASFRPVRVKQRGT